MRAMALAANWLSQPENRMMAGESLSRTAYPDVEDTIIDRALRGRIVPSATGSAVEVRGFLRFHAQCANFRWRSQAAWIAARLARGAGLELKSAIAAGRATFRPDLYRRHMAQMGLDMPGALEKVQVALSRTEPVASIRGEISLVPDSFFDGHILDPDTPWPLNNSASQHSSAGLRQCRDRSL